MLSSLSPARPRSSGRGPSQPVTSLHPLHCTPVLCSGTNGPTIVLDSTADCSGSAVAFPPTRVVFEAVPWSPVTSDVTGDQAMAGHALGECTLPRGLGALAGVAVQSLSSSWDETDGSPIDLFAAADCAASAGPVTTYLRAPLGTCTPFIQLAAARADACTAAGLTVSVFPGDLECSNAPVLPSLAAVTLPVDGTCMNLFPATGAGPFPAGFSVRVTQPCVTQGEQEGEVGEGPVQQEPSPSSSSSPVASSSVPAASADANGAASLRLSWGLAVMAALVYAAAGH